MFNFLPHSRSVTTQQYNQLRAELREFKLSYDALVDSLETTIQNRIIADRQQQESKAVDVADARQSSDVPFVEIISDGYDPELGVQLQLDWNAAFIAELKSKGYKGSSDRDVVNKWLIAVHKQLAAQFEQADRV